MATFDEKNAADRARSAASQNQLLAYLATNPPEDERRHYVAGYNAAAKQNYLQHEFDVGGVDALVGLTGGDPETLNLTGYAGKYPYNNFSFLGDNFFPAVALAALAIGGAGAYGAYGAGAAGAEAAPAAGAETIGGEGASLGLGPGEAAGVTPGLAGTGTGGGGILGTGVTGSQVLSGARTALSAGSALSTLAKAAGILGGGLAGAAVGTGDTGGAGTHTAGVQDTQEVLRRGRELGQAGVPLQVSNLLSSVAQLRARAAGSTAEIFPDVIDRLQDLRTQYAGASQAISRRLGFAGGGQVERAKGQLLGQAAEQYGGLLEKQQKAAMANLIQTLGGLQPSLSGAARAPSVSIRTGPNTDAPLFGAGLASLVNTGQNLQRWYARPAQPTPNPYAYNQPIGPTQEGGFYPAYDYQAYDSNYAL